MRRNVTALWLVAAATLSFGIGAATTMAFKSEPRPGSGGEPDPVASSAVCPEIPAEQIAAAAELAALLANTTVAKALDPRDPVSFNEIVDEHNSVHTL